MIKLSMTNAATNTKTVLVVIIQIQTTMNEWINSIVISDQIGIVTLVAVCLLGVISVFTCACNFAVLGIVAGYTSTLEAIGKAKTVLFTSLFFFLGTIVAMCVLGCVIVFASEFISDAMGDYWRIGMGIILILFGTYILDIFPFKIHHFTFNFKHKRDGITGGILFGFVVGTLTSLGTLCCNPIFPMIVAASIVTGSKLWSFLMLLAYAFGFGATLASIMLGFGMGIGKLSKLLSKSAKIIKYAGGIILIVLGFYFIITA